MSPAAGVHELSLGGITVGLLGGLSLFLFGMGQLTETLKAVTGERMRRLLAGLTTNRFVAALTGAFVTAVIQSSSVTTVLLVGFISAGLMTLTQSVGVIMGANVGTTITAQIIAFKVTEYALGLIAIGFAMVFFGRREKLQQLGTMVMGLGLIFFGMSLMSDATEPLRGHAPFIEVMSSMDRPVWGILVAAAFTALVQSSSATTGIVIVLAGQGFITLEAGIALAFGANIGTCVTAWLASLGRPRSAKQAALIHVLFNVLGVLIWLPFLDDLAQVVRLISPRAEHLAGAMQLAAETPRQIANAHTLFNAANTLIFIGFTTPLARLATRLLPEKPEALPVPVEARYLQDIYLGTPSLALDRIRLEIARVGEWVLEIFNSVTDRMEHRLQELEPIGDRARDVELLSVVILDYSRRLLQSSLTSAESAKLEHYLSVVNHLQNISNTIALNLGVFAGEWQARRLKASEPTRRIFKEFAKEIARALELATQAVKENDVELAGRVMAMKSEINRRAELLANRLSERLASDDPDRIVIYRLESQVREVLRRVYYFAKRIAKAVSAEIPEAPDEVPTLGQREQDRGPDTNTE